VKKFDDGSKPRGDESRRGFFYFQSQKRRPSLYEELTVDTQPSVERHLTGGWLLSFADGRGTHSLGSTALRVKDWFDWRDPAGLWERPFYQQAAQAAREQDAAVAVANAEGLFDRFSEEWRSFLQTSLQLPAFYAYGLWRALCGASRPALSDTITHAIVLQAAMIQRQAQDLVVYAMDLEPAIGECSIDAAKKRFLEEEGWQPVRALVEHLHAVGDWNERVLAANLCIEPLVGTLLRREMLLIPAAANGDSVTPVIIGAAQREWHWVRDWTTELVRFCVEDEAFGELNREIIAKWAESWNREAEAAAEAVVREIERVPHARPAGEALEQVRRERDELQSALQRQEVAA
jgi:methane monooxygenase component A beta chain/propane monooxygenase small subunit